MSFLQATSEENPLSSALEQIAAIDREIDAVEITVKELKKRRDALASVAVEEMTTGRLDGVRVAGRSWRVEWEHRVSATGEHQDAILAAARAAGLEEQLISVNTSRLKSASSPNTVAMRSRSSRVKTALWSGRSYTYGFFMTMRAVGIR